MPEKEVTVYTQPGCAPCHAVVEFLNQNNVPFEQKDIRSNPQYIQELQQLGASATPTTVIGDEVIIGFDKMEIQKKLNL